MLLNETAMGIPWPGGFSPEQCQSSASGSLEESILVQRAKLLIGHFGINSETNPELNLGSVC